MGGTIASVVLGGSYTSFLAVIHGIHGKADLVSHFFRRTVGLLNKEGAAGLLATKTIAQGETCDGSLGYLCRNKGQVFRATTAFPWPGAAAATVSIVHFVRSAKEFECVLDGRLVKQISTSLEADTEFDASVALSLARNASIGFKGSAVIGMGFVIEEEEAKRVIAQGPHSRQVILPFLTGEDLNSRSDSSPSRLIISFKGRPLVECEKYPACLEMVRDRVKPHRDKANRDAHRERWWQYGDWRPGLYRAISTRNRVLAIALTTKYLAPQFVLSNHESDQSVVVIADDSNEVFGCLSSNIHNVWAWSLTTTSLAGSFRYNTTLCLQTFPFPDLAYLNNYNSIFTSYDQVRRLFMQSERIGLTATYNRFHNPDESAIDIQRLSSRFALLKGGD